MKKRFMKAILCLTVAFVMFFSGLSVPCFSIAKASYAPSTSEIERPESLSEGLSRKSLAELQGKRVTIREPQMVVLRRGLERHEPAVLPNTFTLPDFSTGKLTNAKIDFSHYPGKGQSGETFTNFEKYMLLREVFWYNQNAMEDAKNGTLMKHPAADLQYGKIEVKDNAVEKWILTDPEYKSPMTTGLYLAPGEVATVVVDGLKEGESVTLYTHHQSTMAYLNGDNYFEKTDKLIIDESKKANPNYESLPITLNGQYARQNEEIPAMGATFVLPGNGTYQIGCPFGGALYVKPTSSPTELTITGAIETPHFILGVTTVEEFNNYLKDAPGLFATLDCENGQLIGPSEAMRNTDDIEKLAYFWHSAFAVNSSFNGRAYNYNVTLSFDTHVPAGAAVALSSDRAAMPVNWFPTCMNYGKITTEGQWGTFHELGHIHAKTYNTNWGMRDSKEGEVWNNTLIILIYTLLCNMDNRVVGVEHGEFVHPYTTLQYVAGRNIEGDYSNGDYFDMLSLYATLIHSFGPETFVDFLYTYNINPQYCNNTRADFAYRFSTVTNMNFVKWLNKVYKANITNEMFSRDQLKFLNSLDSFYPIAYRYANGTNEHESARKHEVDFYHPTLFDFSGDNILCPVAFEIISYTNPLHGSISISGDLTKVTYTPPKDDIYESDEFSVRVRIKSTGVDVYLPVRFNFGYQNAYTTVWDDIKTRNLPTALEYIKTHEPSYTKLEKYPGVKDFNANINGKSFESFLSTKFKFIVPKSGTYKFYTRSDDTSVVNFFLDGENFGSLTIYNDRSYYSTTDFVTKELKENDIISIETSHINYGGRCYLTVGVMLPETDTIIDLPKENILNYELDKESLEKTESFGWQPKFFVSIKNAYKQTYSDKTGWEVISAPESQGVDLKDKMVDGDPSTFFHGKYSPSSVPFPHTFIIDTQSIQKFNFFEITTRNHFNSFITSMTLFGSTDDIEYKKLVSTSSLTYQGLKASVTFDETDIRYFKLVVYATTSNSGQMFTVIAEVDAGLSAKMEQPLKPSTLGENATANGFEENEFGALSSKKSGSVFSFEFVGTGFDVFANKGPEFGTAKVYIDGDEAGQIILTGERVLNSVVFSIKNLFSTKHTVRIETQDDAEFNISFLNVNYGVDTGEEVVPAPEKIVPSPNEKYVGGHTYGEKVVLTPEPDEVEPTKPNPPPPSSGSQTEESEGESEEASKPDNKTVMIICIGVGGAIVLFIGGLAILKVLTSDKKNDSKDNKPSSKKKSSQKKNSSSSKKK